VEVGVGRIRATSSMKARLGELPLKHRLSANRPDKQVLRPFEASTTGSCQPEVDCLKQCWYNSGLHNSSAADASVRRMKPRSNEFSGDSCRADSTVVSRSSKSSVRLELHSNSTWLTAASRTSCRHQIEAPSERRLNRESRSDESRQGR